MPEHPVAASGKTRVYGILGNPVAHSLSPLIHNAAFQFKKIDAAYVPFHTTQTGAFLKKAVISMGIRGLSITIPHKIWAAKAADQKDPLTKLCGAANTWIIENGIVSAHNTDGPGAVRAMQEKHKGVGKRYLILGYGGSALAIAHALLLESSPRSITITGRNLKKAVRFAEDLRQAHARHRSLIDSAPLSQIAPEQIDAVIQTTPSGMNAEKGSKVLPELGFDPDWITKNHLVFDVIYVPMRTPLIELAERRGSTIVYGYKMLLYQAVRQFELFTGQSAPESLMERLLLSHLRNRTRR